MTKHRDFDLQRFVAGVTTEALMAFLGRFGLEPPSGWATIHGEALRGWLAEPEQADAEPTVLEHLRRVNDLGLRSAGALYAACEKHGITSGPGESLEQLALRIFLEDEEAFDYAWSRYLLYTNVEFLTEYYFPAGRIEVSNEQRLGFQRQLRDSLASLARGRQCRVDAHSDDDEAVIVIQRGHYLRTVPLFASETSDDIDYRNFRPVVDDLIFYDPHSSILRIKATTRTERETYLGLFAHHIAGRDDLVMNALNEQVYTLEPLQNGTFSYSGSGAIVGVRLVRARIQFGPKAYDDVVAEDVLRALATRELGISLQSGPLLQVALMFEFQVGKDIRPVRCEIRPPSRGWVRDRRFEPAISQYLREQCVKLR
jgi:hypothetical protein